MAVSIDAQAAIAKIADSLSPQTGVGNFIDEFRGKLIEDSAQAWRDYAPLDFMHETARYGNTDPSLKLGMISNPYAGQVIDLGMKPLPPTLGFDTMGLTSYQGEDAESDTLTKLVEVMNYDSPKSFFDEHQAKGNIREGLSYDEWASQTRKLSKGDIAVMINAHARNPMDPSTWSHEWGHVGQIEISKRGSGREERQRMRDILYADSRNLNLLEEDIEWFEDRKVPVGGDTWNKILQKTLIEDEYANIALAKIGKSPGAEPNPQVFKNWIRGGRTEEGYKMARGERRMYEEMTGYPNQIGAEPKPGFFDFIIGLFK